MKAVVTLEQRFFESRGEWYSTGAFPESFWERYLEVFDEVLIVARAKKVDFVEENMVKVTNSKVKGRALPHYIGIKEAFQKRALLKRSLKKLVEEERGAYILRVGSPLADILAPLLRKKGAPYAVEVVGDPWDVFAPGAIKHPLRPLLRAYFSRKLKAQCAHADFASYVTEFALQERYPAPKAVATTHASSIDLREEHFYIRNIKEDFKVSNFLYVGTLEQLQKAPDILIKAFALAKAKRDDIRLGLIGDGRERPMLERLALSLGLQDKVTFYGHFNGPDAVRLKLQEYDAFILPSRGEGLPRAMIEAMASSMVCIGSSIGGIEELIPKEWIAPVGDAVALSEKILKARELGAQAASEIQRRNFNEAKKYLREEVGERRRNFYKKYRAFLEAKK